MNNKNSRKPTIKDIAKIAGVSHSTVSRSLNNSELISEDTKEKIKKIAEDIGFTFNSNARSLSTSRTNTVAVIIGEVFNEFKAGLFFGALTKYVLDTMEKNSIDIITKFPYNKFTGDSNSTRLIRMRKVDGLVLAYSGIDKSDWEIIKESKIPYVLLHSKPMYFDPGEENDSFITDHFEGGYLATKHLVECGYKRIMTLSAVPEEWEFKQRLNGYKWALEEAGIEIEERNIIIGDLSYECGMNFIEKNYKLIAKGTAIFAQTDLMAMGIIEGAKKNGIKIPEDLGVVGYDDLEIGKYYWPQLTTVHQPIEEIATLASERLLYLIKNRECKEKINIIIKPTLVVRESTTKYYKG